MFESPLGINMSTSLPPRKKNFRKVYDILLFSTVVVVLVISFTGVIYPHHTHIQCGDPYISHANYKDTISVTTLALVSIIAPFVMILIVEWINFFNRPIPNPFKRALKSTYYLFLSYFVGNLFGLFIVEMLKTTVSEPRPNFMSTCSPNLTEEICKNQWIHITWENCTNPLNLSHIGVLDTMKSFPSGHASISIFTAVFMTIYIQERIKISWSDLFPMWLHLMWWTWALLCCASRVWDKKHHWWDVLFGAIIGIIVSYATVKRVYKSFWENDKRSTPEMKLTDDKACLPKKLKGNFNTSHPSSALNAESKETRNSQASVPKC